MAHVLPGRVLSQKDRYPLIRGYIPFFNHNWDPCMIEGI